MSDIVEQLTRAITTASNDDYSVVATASRARSTQRIDAMMGAKAEITRLRARVAELEAGLREIAELRAEDLYYGPDAEGIDNTAAAHARSLLAGEPAAQTESE